MTEEELRAAAWAYAHNAEGTRVIFERRAQSLKLLTKIRDFVGLAVPISLAYLYGSDVFEFLKPYRAIGIASVTVTASAQLLFFAWSLISHWDEELAYAVRSGRDSYLLKEEWKSLGNGESANPKVEFDLLKERQQIVDSHDIEKGISYKEKQIGMRAGLIEFHAQCVCGQRPNGRAPPWRKRIVCQVCGGN